MTENNSRHVSYDQIKAVVEFMGRHVDFASGVLRSLRLRHINRKLWIELSNILNNMESGTKKTADGWRKYWNDFKNKIRRKVILMNLKHSGSKANVKPLTKLERKILEILGPDFTRTPYRGRTLHRCPSKLKLEERNFNLSIGMDNISNKTDYEKDDSEDSKRSHDSDADSNRLELQNNVYPRWLINIEKKRSDVELRRAKAEERQADIAAQNAETARIQAEALSKLADSASAQAEAMLRIALALESKNNSIHVNL